MFHGMEIREKYIFSFKGESGVETLILIQLFKAVIKEVKQVWEALKIINQLKISKIKEFFLIIHKIISKIGKK